MKKRYQITPAVYLMLVKNEKILLLRRFNTGYEDGNYSMVAGHIENGETVKQSIIKEAKEEANIKLNKKDLEVIHAMYRKGPNDGRIDIFIKAKKYSGKIQSMEPKKCDDLQWFPLKKLPKNMIPCIRYGIKCIEKKIFYSEFGW